MKTLAKAFVSAALAALLIACSREKEAAYMGETVNFGVSAMSGALTKTVYSGELTDADIERINWVDGDLIRIVCNEVSAPEEKYFDYELSVSGNSGRYSYASAVPYNAGNGLQWGEGSHAFYSVYPSPVTPGSISLEIADGAGRALAVLPEDQSTSSDKKEGDTENRYYGNMDLAFMTAATQASPGDNVTLSFTPIVTTFYVTVFNTTGSAMTLRKVALSSASNALTATYRTVFTTAGNRTYSFSEAGTWAGTPTWSESNSTVFASFDGLSLADGDHVTVALFAIPKDITQLTLAVTSDETGTVKLPLKYSNGTWLSFTGGDKHNINNIGIPAVSYELTVDKTLLTYDYTGTAGSEQEFTVTSNKTIGSSVTAAPWKTQIKKDGKWVDLEGNCPEWLEAFPVNSTGITSVSKTYQEDVDEQIVTSHVERLRQGKVYDQSGNVYDNSEKSNALDLSKYNFINKRQETLRTTANTYIVSAPGWYKIPMVYGNLIENGATVAKSCKGARWSLGHLDYFKKATDANIFLGINYPWLQAAFLDHCRIHWEKYTVWEGDAAVTSGRQWSQGSDTGVITELELNNSEEYMYFRVDPDMIRPGNALLATYGSDGDCCWSWQIWITDQNMSLITVGSNRVLPVNIGWTDDTEGQYYAERSDTLKFVSTEIAGLESLEMVVKQPEFERVSTSGWQTYYQWGRKDPLSTGVTNVYNDDGALNKSILHPSNIMYDESTSGSDKYYDWTSANYNNLWDSQNTSWKTPSDQLPDHKTVYDPSPRGFSVAPDTAWDGFATYGYSSFENGLFFYTSNDHDQTIFFPASGYMDFTTANISNSGKDGYYWTIRPGANTQSRASYSLRFSKSDSGTISVVAKQYDAVSPFNTAAYRACAYSVRPVLYNVSAEASEDI
ncbi:MAG: hypothetical protein IJ795_04470 [Bacteroidales bacterium]|nr:hypothetical protein [Bacteroidales bacterium]